VNFDVFISYSSKDKTVADAVCARLESAAIRCWIAPRDVVPGTSYGEGIIDAIHAAKIMVLVFSSSANSSGHIPKEVERAVSNGLTILPFRIENVPPGKSLDYFIGSVHWLDAMTPPMEKHLDDLAATVHKLLPTEPRDQVIPGTEPSWASQRNAPSISSTTSRETVAHSATNRQTAASSKPIWIALVAIAVLSCLVLAVKVYRGGGNPPQPAANVPNAPVAPNVVTPPPSVPTPASDSMPVADLVKKKLAEAAKLIADEPIVGCYQWFNDAPVVIHADGTMVGGPFKGHWRLMTASETQRTYTFTWPEATDTVTIAPDQQSLSGGNQYGYPTSGTRIAGNYGLTGAWRWPNGVPVTVLPNGTFTAATFHGRWKATDAAHGIYTLTWPNPVDSVTLSTDGSRIFGANQYGVAISGVRTKPCSEN
jgi:hypothetical protein